MSEHAFFDKKIHTTKLTKPLGVKKLEMISAFWPITSEDFKPLPQRIGTASRCKVPPFGCGKGLTWVVTESKRIKSLPTNSVRKVSVVVFMYWTSQLKNLKVVMLEARLEDGLNS